jgi:hypothetical protein
MLNGKFTSQHCYMPWKKTIPIEESSFVSGFNIRYMRMKSSWAKLFGLMKQLSWTVQLTTILVHIGFQKIHTFMWREQTIYQTHCLVWTVILGFNWTVLFLNEQLPQHALDIHFTCHSSALKEWAFSSKKMVHHNITTKTSEATSMKPYQVHGQDEEVVLEYHPHSPDFYLWGSLNDVAYHRKTLTLEMLWEETDTTCSAIPVDTLPTVTRALVCWTQKCLNTLVLVQQVSQSSLSVHIKLGLPIN